MRKLLVLLLVALLSLMLAACGGEATPEPTEPSPETVETEEADAEAETEAEAEAEGEDTEGEAEEMEAEGDAASGEFAGETLRLATTTSTDDSGLLDFLLPNFEAQTGATVDVIAVGTGQALELGENGDADVVLVHARAREDAFVEAGHAPARFDVMFNDFVIVGPEADPVGIAGSESATDAFTQIAEAEAPFISRGDDSGTHSKELSVWEAAGITPEGEWYQEVGQGMGATLGVADELNGYTLADRATYLALQAEGNELVIVVEGDEILFNPYGVMAVDPSKNDAINGELADAFVEWLISVDTQELIAKFEVNGNQLFTPNSEAYLAAQ